MGSVRVFVCRSSKAVSGSIGVLRWRQPAGNTERRTHSESTAANSFHMQQPRVSGISVKTSTIMLIFTHFGFLLYETTV